MKTKLKNSNGFTIIEVLIVLAIAGLILLIVFLAVPALQRNQRNTSRRSDASLVGAAASNFVTNANGTVPSTAAHVDTIRAELTNLGQFNLTASAASAACPAAITTATLRVCGGAQTFTAAAGVDGMTLGTGVQCSGVDAFVPGTQRQLALVYTLERPGTARSMACINL